MLMNRNVVLFLILTLLSRGVWGQQPVQYAFTHYKLADGLASNIVNNVVQDGKGYMWLATINGLQRFDGNKFLTFRNDPGRVASLPSDEVNWVYADRKKNLWVLTSDNKVGRFDINTFHYKEVPVKQWNKGNVYVQKTFLETQDGRLLLYINYTTNIFEYNASANAFIPTSIVPVPANRKINCIIQDSITHKYYMTTDSGFVVYNPKTNNLSYAGKNTENEPLINVCGSEREINYLYLDQNRRLFFEQWTKSAVHPLLKLFDLKSNTKKEHNLKAEYQMGYHQIRGILQQQNGKVWIGGLPFLAEYTTNAIPFVFIKRNYGKENELRFNKVFSLYEDQQRDVWVCTDYGVYLFNPDAQVFNSYTLSLPERHTVEGRAQTAYQFENGEIWVGYRDLGLHRYNSKMHPLPIPASIVPFQQMKSVWDIHQHSKTGNVWIALQGGKLIIYDTATKKAQHLTPPPFGQRAITQITEDASGNLWLGTQSGNLVKWDWQVGSKNLEAGFSLILKTGIIDKLFTDNRGVVWVAAFGEGLLKVDPVKNKLVHRILKNSLKGFNLWSNDPKDIIQYNDSLLLVASGALNLVNLNTNSVSHITAHDGLPSNTVLSLAKDASGILWLGTLSGLCRGDLGKSSFTLYNQNDGITNDDFNIAGAHALRDGRLLFTSAESFIVFDPAKTNRSGAIRQAFITDFKLSNVTLPIDSLQALNHVNLSHDKNSVLFEFSALNFCKQNKLDYYYQLEGFDTSWIKSDDRHQAVYNFLPPGEYQFKVKAKSIDGVFSNQIAQLNLLVNPPFWNTWWFYTLIVLALFLVLYLIDRERMRRLVTLHNVRSDIASHLHQDVSTTLNNINVLSQIAKLKADKDIIRSKELIDEIGDKSYNMVITMDEILWSIDPDNDTMEKTLLRIFEFAQTLETNYSVAIDIGVHEKVKDLRLDMKVRHDFLILCKEALHGLAQHAKDTSILVDIDLVRSKILLKILSIVPEVPKNNSNNLELKERLEKRAAAMHANFAYETSKRETSVVLSIPLK
jgi:ligand-binding sensor domain-containing protein